MVKNLVTSGAARFCAREHPDYASGRCKNTRPNCGRDASKSVLGIFRIAVRGDVGHGECEIGWWGGNGLSLAAYLVIYDVWGQLLVIFVEM